jgi:hypothetical protein
MLRDLESLIEVSNYGTNESNQQDVKDLMVSISNSRVGDQRMNLSGKWELVYTTEKEINCKDDERWIDWPWMGFFFPTKTKCVCVFVCVCNEYDSNTQYSLS